jgi:diguanylate cyclase (GGDEF)-like protein/putative nucleotidyltransferase with HDIG domain
MAEAPADILIVDDEPEIRSVLRDALASETRRCTTAETGEQAIALLQQRPFDAVVSDIAMPGMSGLDLLAEAQAVRPDCSMVLITGHGSMDWAKDAIRKGAFDYIEKPFDLSSLSDTVDRAVTAGRENREASHGPGAEPAVRTHHDPLTGLPNHSCFVDQLKRLRALARRTNQPLTILMVDVDGFHRINEAHGHNVGDSVLRGIGQCLRSTARESDLVARYGWDQFVVVLYETNASTAEPLARRYLENVRGLTVGSQAEPVTCTVSIGLCECETGFVEGETDLLRRAGEALVEAKNRGGNTFVTWSTLDRASQWVDLGPLASSLGAMRDACAQLQHQIRQSYLESTRALVAAVEAKDPYTEKHSMTVTHYAVAFARELGLPESQIQTIATAGILHDIGKIGVPDAILTKPGRLTEDEFELVKQHPRMGVQILSHIRFLRGELPLILHHHERWNGRGYPAGLAGEAIPLGARILHLADSLDAMLSARSYKTGYDVTRASRELQTHAGRQFDPNLVSMVTRWLEKNPHQIVLPHERDAVLPKLLEDSDLGDWLQEPS